ncbi:ABC transporter permease [Rhodococcus opacus]|uniref:ABC transporter permease n=1 Tax=Rhodococcus opacus TaxID=37919 RepID=UPI001C455ADD|nr:ABC transporter permease [Rhodococcus opacus]MBV6756648.1 ABC transporter permease [Rhodococcus opacus]
MSDLANSARSGGGKAGDIEPSRSRALSASGAIERYALVGLLVCIVLFFSVYPATGDLFRSTANLRYLLASQAVTAIIALGMVIPLIAGYFDLTVPAIAGLSAVLVSALLCNYSVSIPLALVAGVGAGAVVGAINGWLCAVIKLNALITTLAGYTLIGGLLLAYTKGQQINSGFPEALGDWTTFQWLGLPNPFWLVVVVALIGWYVTTQTPHGRKLIAIGSNENAARLAGIRVNRIVFSAFVLSGVLGGLAGTLLAIRTGGADATAGQSFLFPAMAAVFLGQTAFTPGRYNVWGTVVGVFAVAVAVNGLSLLGAQSWVQPVFNGTALILSVAISTLTARARQRRAGRALLEMAGPRDGTDAEVKVDQLLPPKTTVVRG